MIRILAVVLALSVGLNVGFAVRALRSPSPPPPAGPPGGQHEMKLARTMDRHLEMMIEDLGLDAAQQAAIREAHQALFPPIRDALENVELLRDAAAGAFRAEVDAPELFRARVRELQRSRAEVDSLLTEVLLAEVAVLDPKQRDRYIETSPWRGRPGRRSEAGPPPGNGPAGERPPGERLPGERPPGERPPGERPPGERSPGERPPGERSPGERPPGERPPGEQPEGERSPG